MTRAERRVAVVGAGVLSCMGADYRDQWRRILDGETGLRHVGTGGYPEMQWFGTADTDDLAVKDRRRLRRLGRASFLGVLAADLAVADAGAVFTAVPPDRRGIYVGSSEQDMDHAERFHPVLGRGRAPDGSLDLNRTARDGLRRITPDFLLSGLPNGALCQVTIRHAIHGTSSTFVESAGMGLAAVGRAFRSVRNGRADVAVCGGTHSSDHPFARLGLRAVGQLSPSGILRPFDVRRDGYVASEGAAFLVLADLDLAVRHGARVLAEVAGYGAASGTTTWRGPDDGRGTRSAVAGALADAAVDPGDVGWAYAHGDGTVEGDRTELSGLSAVLDGTPVTGTKASTGHMGPATDVAEAAFAALGLDEGVIPPTLNHKTTLDGPAEVVAHRPRNSGARYALTTSRNSYGPETVALLLKKGG